MRNVISSKAFVVDIILGPRKTQELDYAEYTVNPITRVYLFFFFFINPVYTYGTYRLRDDGAHSVDDETKL